MFRTTWTPCILWSIKLIEKRTTQELTNLLGLEDTLAGLSGASGVQWYGNVLRRVNDDVLRKGMDFEMVGKRGRGWPKMT